ncbi:glycosyltransferase family 2 protein [Leucobacter sp. NPDC077196]|uniref:glycosyltransferase family 2 protein n=1 Tax=Leucobacter sp. NPDC077196 TaxID=3154959 RepID=UPI00342F7A6D
MSTSLSAPPLLSIVVPVYNEAAGVNDFHYGHLLPALIELGETFEVIYVDDGSTDATRLLVEMIAAADERIRVAALARNFGKEIATTAGIHQARGQATLIMDGDGQHPPSEVHRFVEQWRSGAQVVVGVRTGNQREGVVKKWGSRAFYALFNATSGAEMIPRSTDFRLIDSEVREAFKAFPERQRITRALIDWLGFDRVILEFESPARIAGEATYSVRQLVKLAVNSYVSLSLKPLYFFGWVGGLITALSLIVGLAVTVEQFLLGDPLQLNFTGSALLGIFISFLVGLVLMSQAMLAVYVAHVHEQTQGRPLFVLNRSRSVGL